jgi:protein TonB
MNCSARPTAADDDNNAPTRGVSVHWGWLAFVASAHAAGLIAIANRDISPSTTALITEPQVIEFSLVTPTAAPKAIPVAPPLPAKPDVRPPQPTTQKPAKTPPPQAKPSPPQPPLASDAAQPPKPRAPTAEITPPETSTQVAANPPATPPDSDEMTARHQSAAPMSGPSVAAAPMAIQKGPIVQRDAQYLDTPPPAYPRYLRKRGMEGTVLLRVEILADGSAGKVEVIEKSPFAQLDELAREKVRTWRFVPAHQGDKAIDSSMTIPVEFRLTD